MPLRRLKDIYEKRKSTLKNALEKNSLSKDRKAEIIGAMSEIDALIKTIDTLRMQEIEDNRLLEVKGASNVLDNIPIINRLGSKDKSKFENSGTKHSLNEAFIKKCEVRTRYEIFGDIAKEEGYDHIAQVFHDTANNEREQARIILEYMKENHDTITNLRTSSDIERSYHEYYYTRYEKISTEEKYNVITEFFKELAQIDVEHEKRFLKILHSMNDKKVFRREMITKWRCRKCGYILEAQEAPTKCKVCKGLKGKFEVYHEGI